MLPFGWHSDPPISMNPLLSYPPSNRLRLAPAFIFASVLALLVGLSAATVTVGQTAASAPDQGPNANDLVELSPFTVTTSRDTGYAATNTLAGTRLKSEIANTPVSLSVMTREFLNDIGATDANKAIEYGLNA